MPTRPSWLTFVRGRLPAFLALLAVVIHAAVAVSQAPAAALSADAQLASDLGIICAPGSPQSHTDHGGLPEHGDRHCPACIGLGGAPAVVPVSVCLAPVSAARQPSIIGFAGIAPSFPGGVPRGRGPPSIV